MRLSKASILNWGRFDYLIGAKVSKWDLIIYDDVDAYFLEEKNK